MARDIGRNLVAIQEFGEMPSNMDLNMKEGIRLSGSVVDSAGAPISNVMLNLCFASGYTYHQLRPQPDKTDAHGLFSVSALPQGRFYILDPTAPGYVAAHGQLTARESQTNRYKLPTFMLKPMNRKLAGKVIGPDGKPVAGAKVRYWEDGASADRPEPMTDDQGRFAFNDLCEGPVAVGASKADSHGNVAAHAGDTNIVIRLGIIAVEGGP
jgi:protocatechuate 3,4-dioxygenase beta subunit